MPFSHYFYLISSLNILCQKYKLDVISVFLSVLRLVLEPRIWSILKNVLCALGKSAYADLLKWNVLFIISKSNWPFNTAFSLLIFFLYDLFFDVHGVLMSSTFIVLLFLPLYLLIFYIFTCSYIRCICVHGCCILFLHWTIYRDVMLFFIFCYSHCFEVYIVWYEYCYPRFLSISICMKYLFPSLTFSLFLSSALKGLSSRQHICIYIYRFDLFNQSSILCPLIGTSFDLYHDYWQVYTYCHFVTCFDAVFVVLSLSFSFYFLVLDSSFMVTHGLAWNITGRCCASSGFVSYCEAQTSDNPNHFK